MIRPNLPNRPNQPQTLTSEGGQWTRRGLLWGFAALAAEGLACRNLFRHGEPAPRDGGARFDGTPITKLGDFLTPTPKLFVRDHFGVPDLAKLPTQDWALSVGGDVEHPLEIRLSDLADLARLAAPVLLECAGNAGRNGIGWPGAGRAWVGAGTSIFAGFSLAALLRRAAPRASVQEIVLSGADAGAERGSNERHTFARSVPLRAALLDSAILATEMNGEPLPRRHGGPLRAIFPSRYATDSVKWLTRIEALSHPFDGFYQKERYRRATPADPTGQSLGELRVQSEISKPRAGQRLPMGLTVEVLGVAWAGPVGLDRVEVSADGGQTFSIANFLDPERPGCWRRWRWLWRPTQAGPRLLMARATDRGGQTQPLESEEELGMSYSLSGPDRIQYANNTVPLVPVTVT